MPRDPLTSSRSSAVTRAAIWSAAAALSAKRWTRAAARPAPTAPSTKPSAAGPPTTTRAATPAAAAARPHASWRRRETSPSSSISPSTANRRPRTAVAASVASMACTAAGLALYEQLDDLGLAGQVVRQGAAPGEGRSSASRRTIAAGSIPNSVATWSPPPGYGQLRAAGQGHRDGERPGGGCRVPRSCRQTPDRSRGPRAHQRCGVRRTSRAVRATARPVP